MIPGLLEFSGKNPNIRQCDNLTEGTDTEEWLSITLFDFISSPEKFGCPLPCERNFYSYNLNYIHLRSEFQLGRLKSTFGRTHFFNFLIKSV
jgi:hypothetical protein